MKTIYLLKGLPASGKTTWAKSLLLKHPGEYKRINKDDIREMLDAGKWSRENEKMVLQVRDDLIIIALQHGKHVIIDDTNLHPKHEERMREIAKAWTGSGNQVLVVVREFEIGLEEAIRRDLRRPISVGEKIIRDMHKRFIAPPPVKPPAHDPSLVDAIICDIDGTIAKMTSRGPYDWDKVGGDIPNWPILEILHRFNKSHIIILLSGRDGSARGETEDWLKRYEIPFQHLLMRSPGDTRKDYDVKKELYYRNIKDIYNVRFVLDDRDQVVDLWRNGLGLTCLQVDYGNF